MNNNFKTDFMMRVLIFSLLSLLASFSFAASAQEQKTYLNVDNFIASQSICCVDSEKVDINNDNKLDHILFCSGGETTYLEILINSGKNFVLLSMPAGEEYETIDNADQKEIKIGFGTYPQFGDVHGSDKYYWYDFYVIKGLSSVLNNSQHSGFYKEITVKYKKRIQELNNDIKKLKANKVDEFIIQIRKDHIIRYKEFITKAEKLYQ